MTTPEYKPAKHIIIIRSSSNTEGVLGKRASF